MDDATQNRIIFVLGMLIGWVTAYIAHELASRKNNRRK